MIRSNDAPHAEIAHLGVGRAAKDPSTLWPEAVVHTLTPAVAALLPASPAAQVATVRSAVAEAAHVTPSAIELPLSVSVLPTGAALICLARGGQAERALQVLARRRGTNAVEALNAAVRGV